MGKGSGALQREILDTLENARHDKLGYRGFGGIDGDDYLPAGHRWRLPGWVTVKGHIVRLGLTAYDLRASCRYLARKHGQIQYGGITAPFSASFSRAVATLIQRGDLIPLKSLLPISDVDPLSRGRSGHVEHRPDGMFLSLNSPRRASSCARRPRHQGTEWIRPLSSH
jgi:hypothetical protein